MLYCLLCSLELASSTLAWSNCDLMTSSSSFLAFLLSSSSLTFFSCYDFFTNNSAYCFSISSFWFWLALILFLTSLSSFWLDSTLTWRISFYFSSYSLAMVYSWTSATWPSVYESFCSIIMCNLFIYAFNFYIFCLDSSSCSFESSRYLYVLATSALR